VSDVRCFKNLGRKPADGDDTAAARQLVEERTRRSYFRAGGTPIRGRRTGMRRNDIPEQHVIDNTELSQDALHNLALASAAPKPVSCRSDVNGIPLIRAPR
jgi:hypothetical protein